VIEFGHYNCNVKRLPDPTHPSNISYRDVDPRKLFPWKTRATPTAVTFELRHQFDLAFYTINVEVSHGSYLVSLNKGPSMLVPRNRVVEAVNVLTSHICG